MTSVMEEEQRVFMRVKGGEGQCRTRRKRHLSWYLKGGQRFARLRAGKGFPLRGAPCQAQAEQAHPVLPQKAREKPCARA